MGVIVLLQLKQEKREWSQHSGLKLLCHYEEILHISSKSPYMLMCYKNGLYEVSTSNCDSSMRDY